MSDSFAEVRLDDSLIIYGTSGGDGYSTDVVIVNSGFEKRNQNWTESRGKWDLGERVMMPDDLKTLVAFFRARRGQFQGFRFKDWADYQTDLSDGYLGPVGASVPVSGNGAGSLVYRLYKQYVSGDDVDQRRIFKPVIGSVTLYKNGVPVTLGNMPGQAAIDYTTGTVTFTPTEQHNITSIANGPSTVVTLDAAHSITVGKLVEIDGVQGATGLNGNVYQVTAVPSGNQLTLGVNSSSFGAWTAGGTVSLGPQLTDTLRWVGEFDLPVRFAVDEIKRTFQAADVQTPGQVSAVYFYLQSVPLVELRIKE